MPRFPAFTAGSFRGSEELRSKLFGSFWGKRDHHRESAAPAQEEVYLSASYLSLSPNLYRFQRLNFEMAGCG